MPTVQPLAADLHLRRAHPDDAGALRRLAALDSQPPPLSGAAHLLALSGGELVAAVSLDGAWQAADPFRRSAPAVELLRARRAQLCGPATQRRADALVKRVRRGALAG